MYQTVKIKEDDNIKMEVNEVHEMLENNNAVLGPDGKAMSVSPLDGPLAARSELSCEVCKFIFPTN